jgi:protein ImuB
VYGALHCPAPLPSPGLLAQIARQFTPRVEATGPSPVLLDLSGLSRVWPEPADLGQALHDAATGQGIAAHVALASSRITALLVARARPGVTLVPPGAEARTLAPLPLALLDASEEHLQILTRWGVRTLGDLAALPPGGLAARLGAEGIRLVRSSRGEDAIPLSPTVEAEIFDLGLDLEWPVEGLEPVSFLLSRLLDPLMTTLASRARSALAVGLSLRLADGSYQHRTLLLLELESNPPRDAIVGLAVRAEPTPPRVTQYSLFDPAEPAPEALAELLAGLRDWAADGRVGSARLIDTHRPGAFAVSSFTPGRVVLGSQPSAPHLALRAYRPALLADVAVQQGVPVYVSASGLRGRIIERAGPWRASGDWWDVAWSREEWEVALEGGSLFRIFRDTLAGEWFVEAELD